MRFSVWPNVSQPPSDVLAIAAWAEERGWFGVWIADHYMPNTGTAEVVHGDVHECWAMLAALAARTEQVRIGSLVTPTSVHHPAVLANRATTIDHISNGRMVLGLGAGWQINEHHAYGIDLEPPKQRVDRFAEALEIIRLLHTEPRADFAGEVFTLTGAVADPKPIQSPLPLLVGTASPRMLRLTVQHADEWNTWGGRQWASDRRSLFETACANAGRDPDAMHTSIQALVHLTRSDAERDEVLGGPMAQRSLAGSVGELVDTLGWYADLGYDEFIVPDFHLTGSLAERLELLDRFDREVVAQLA